MDKKKILVADDEVDIRRLVKSTLRADYIILEASNGEEAIDMTRAEKPDLVLMDVLMPKLDGYTACHTITTDHKTSVIPVVMLTGIGHELNKKLSKEMGATGYITKPFTPKELLEVIGRLFSCQ